MTKPLGRKRRRCAAALCSAMTVATAACSFVLGPSSSAAAASAFVGRGDHPTFVPPRPAQQHGRRASKIPYASTDTLPTFRSVEDSWLDSSSAHTTKLTEGRRTHRAFRPLSMRLGDRDDTHDGDNESTKEDEPVDAQMPLESHEPGTADTKDGADLSDANTAANHTATTTTNNNNNDTIAAAANTTTLQRRSSYLSPSDLHSLKSSLSLSSLVESYHLPQFHRTSPTRATCLCPFHDDHNPSMSIDDERGLYKCFSCGAGGDVFNFVREYAKAQEGGREMGFGEAVRWVADEFGGSRSGSAGWDGSGGGWGGLGRNYGPSGNNRGMKGQANVDPAKLQRLALANAAAADYYGTCLSRHPEAGAARAHLQSRHIPPETVRRYALGYAPDAYFGPLVERGLGYGRSKSYETSSSSSSSINSRVRSEKRGDGRRRLKRRGEGSVVEKLRGLGFTPAEIVEAGLAVRTDRKEVNKRKTTATARHSLTKEDVGEGTKDGRNATIAGGSANATEGGTGTISSTATGPNDNDDDDDDHDDDNDYSNLMDRFRGRLVVPIFDAEGKRVVGFGGRHIEPYSSSSSSSFAHDASTTSSKQKKKKYVPAKYLNSAESPIFRKKELLFGAHAAKRTIDADRDRIASQTLGSAPLMEPQALPSANPTVSGVVIVEGYFDAIALASEGVEEAVASMGTALTREQLDLAAEIAGSPGGRIILCFDADDAGQVAMERVCESRLLAKAAEEHSADIRIAQIPLGSSEIKDPADFVRANGGKAFRSEVLEKAVSWSDWYIERLASTYDPSSQESNSTAVETDSPFVEVCERISTFLATFSNREERSRRAYTAASTLSHVLASHQANSGDSNESRVSASSMKLRLESDLMDMAAKKASARDAITARIERIEAVDMENENATRPIGSPGALVAKMSSGEGLTSLIEDDDIDYLAFLGGTQNGKDAKSANSATENNGKQQQRVNSYEYQENKYAASKEQWQYRKPVQKEVPPLIPHFNGFEFANPSDAAWLGIHNKRSSTRQQDPPLVAGGRLAEMRLRREAIEAGQEYVSLGNENQLVYFNSNAFHGQKFLTQEARLAGYGEDGARYSDAQIGLGIPALAEQNADLLLLDAEERLLVTLVHYPSARAAMKGAVRSNAQAGASLIEWSDADREWLFECLTDAPDREDSLPSELQENGTIDQLRDHLASLPDAPPGAFDEERRLERDSMEPKGRLESYFFDDDESSLINLPFGGEMSRETRAELTVQETLAAILRATALKRVSILKERWLSSSTALETKLVSQNNATLEVDTAGDQFVGQYSSHYDEMTIQELESLCSSLSERFSEALKTANELDESAKRISERLMDYCNTGGVEYRISTSKQEKLSNMMDDHINNLPEDPKPDAPGDNENYIFGIDEYDDSIDEQFGGRRPESSIKYANDEEASGRYDGIEDVEDEELDFDFLG